MNWTGISEVVAGKVFSGEMSWQVVSPDSLCEPYNQVFHKYRNRRKTPTPEELIDMLGPSAYMAAVEQASSAKKMPMNWAAMLDKTAVQNEVGQALQKMGKQLIDDPNNIDMARVYAAMSRLDKDGRVWKKMSEVKADTQFFYRTGFAPIDDWMGGMPKGLCIVAGPPGTGKTTLALRLIQCFTAGKKPRKCAIFSMEMMEGQLTARALEVGLTKKQMDHVLIHDEQLSPADVSSLAARAVGAELIIVDFAELMLLGDSLVNESQMAQMYQTLAWTAKRLNVTLVLLAQLSRRYDGNLPTINMIRYSGMAEALASMILLLYNPNQIYVNPDTANTLPISDTGAYIIVGKSRYGYKMGGTGAIGIEWDGAKGWTNDQDSSWTPLALSKITKPLRGEA